METINQTETTNVSKKKNQKKILIIIPVAIIAVLVLAFIFGEKVPKVDEADAIAITADEISEKFLSDKTGTDKEFHNKVYEISGTVKNANSQYSVTFSTESGEYEIYCDMDSEKTNKVPDLEKGDKATIKGLYNRVGTDRIDFKDCLYVTSEKVTEPPTEPETEAKKADNNDSKADIELDRDTIKKVLETSMAQGFDEDSFSVDYNEELDSYVISMWQENFTAMIALSKDDPSVKENWDTMVETLTSTSEQMLESVRTMDPDANITINILNDINKDNILLMIYNGAVVYNELE